MMPLSPLRLAALLVAGTLPLGAQASRDTTLLPVEVVTATRLPGYPRAATATATVLDGAKLRSEGVTHLADALRRVPGLTVARTSSFGSQTALFLRGGQSTYVRVLIDGVPVNEPGGTLDLGRITLDDIERIEVVRGPTSVLYGSEAVTGVIQLFTTRSTAERRLSADVGGGSFESRRAGLGASMGTARSAFAIRGDHHRSDGFLPYNNAYQNDGASASLALSDAAAGDLRLTARYNSSAYHYPTGSGGTLEDRNAERTEHRLLVGLDAGRRWTDRVDTRLQLSTSESHPRTNDGADDAADTLGFYGYYARGTVTRRLASLQASLRLAPAEVLTAGAEFTRETERSSSVSQSEFGDFPDSFRAARETRAAYLQALGDRGPFSYSAGARLDENSAFGTFRTARLGAALQLARNLRLRASAGNAFKAPTFFENFATGFTAGNPALRPERSRSVELGVEALAYRALVLRATGFTQHFTDLIQYTGAPPNPGDPNFYNIAGAHAGGVEFEAELPAYHGFRVALNYTFTETRVADAGFDSGTSANFVAGAPLIRRPKHRGSVALSRGLDGVGVLSATFTGVGERADRDFNSFPATPVTLPPYATLDLGAELTPALLAERGLRVQLRVENVTAARYREIAGYASPRRSIYAGLKFER